MASLPTRLIRTAYSLGWTLALPVAARNDRLRQGWSQRVLRQALPGADLWIQAASVGEAYLALELLRGWTDAGPITALVTTNTAQGMDILNKAASEPPLADGPVRLLSAYSPLDKPSLMRKALSQVSPKALVLLESELWPGQLLACREAGVPVLLVNGRMRTRSMAGYLALGGLMPSLAPDEILAMSEDDAMRLGLVFGAERVSVMANMKFDRVRPGEDLPYVHNPLSTLIRPAQPLAVFGSVRSPEEEAVLAAVRAILVERPRTVIGLFPRHLSRVEPLRRALAARETPHLLRSQAEGPVSPGTVVVWDAFGELGAAYHLARAVFVGGSLAPLGGQNLLEPLAAGVRPLVGPHLGNFAWVGDELFRDGLAEIVHGSDELARALLRDLSRQPEREKTRQAFADYLKPRRGGTAEARKRIAKRLQRGL